MDDHAGRVRQAQVVAELRLRLEVGFGLFSWTEQMLAGTPDAAANPSTGTAPPAAATSTDSALPAPASATARKASRGAGRAAKSATTAGAPRNLRKSRRGDTE